MAKAAARSSAVANGPASGMDPTACPVMNTHGDPAMGHRGEPDEVLLRCSLSALKQSFKHS